MAIKIRIILTLVTSLSVTLGHRGPGHRIRTLGTSECCRRQLPKHFTLWMKSYQVKSTEQYFPGGNVHAVQGRRNF